MKHNITELPNSSIWIRKPFDVGFEPVNDSNVKVVPPHFVYDGDTAVLLGKPPTR